MTLIDPFQRRDIALSTVMIVVVEVLTSQTVPKTEYTVSTTTMVVWMCLPSRGTNMSGICGRPGPTD